VELQSEYFDPKYALLLIYFCSLPAQVKAVNLADLLLLNHFLFSRIVDPRRLCRRRVVLSTPVVRSRGRGERDKKLIEHNASFYARTRYSKTLAVARRLS